jgi:SET domain-containing protein
MRFLSTRSQGDTLFLKLRKDYDENTQTRKQFNSVMRVAKTVGKKVEIVWK